MSKIFDKYRKIYSIIWIVGVSLTFLMLLLQSIGQIYAPSNYQAWLWFLLNLLPLSLLLLYSYSSKFVGKSVKKALFSGTVLLMLTYFSGIFVSIFLQTYMQKQLNWRPIQLLMNSYYILIPIQLVIISILLMQFRIMQGKAVTKVVDFKRKLNNVTAKNQTSTISIENEKKSNDFDLLLSEQRIEILKERIARNQILLAEWESKLTLTDNPNEKWICKNEIEKFKKAIDEDILELKNL